MNKRSKIAILGFGIEGKAMMEYLLKHEFSDITICDKNVDLKAEFPNGVSSKLGEDVYLQDLDKFDVIFRSPGINYLNPQIQTAKNAGVEITSCVKYFMEQCPCPVIGVSGTKGKGTTSTLIYKMLEKGGNDKRQVYLGGNIGEPPTSFLDKLKVSDVVILELSSFQLHDLENSPKYAVLLNTTIDHLDYHADKEEYMEAKEALLEHQEKSSVVVMNKDYEYVKYYKSLVQGKLLFVSRNEKVEDGAYENDGEIFYCKKGKCEKMMNVSDIALIGSHNIENVMPAVCIAKEFDVSSDDIVAAVREFKGLPHRLEFVKEVNGVKYYNDSFATTTETSMAAVDSFDAPTILIAGGHDKGLNYGEWAVKILTRPSLHTVILIGDTADKMEKALMEAEEKLGAAIGSPTRIVRRTTFEEAILEAYSEAEEGFVVVMSPAASSFDMFKNYKERGETFRDLVGRLR